MIEANEILAKIEARQLWAQFHKDLLIEIRTLLRRALPEEYAIFVETEAVIIAPPLSARVATTEPDVAVGRDEAILPVARPGSRSTTAALEVDEDFELYTAYALVIRRAPENRLVAVCEMLSPTNKGLAGKLEKEKCFRKRELYLDAGVNILEIDALLEGDRLVPPALAGLSRYARNAWTVLHGGAKRRWRGWGWDPHEPLPAIDWEVEEGVQASLSLGQALEQAVTFNRWERLAR
ncbi:MAG: DUF4058 family protein [Planctomycetes bacterium]|nr:DUF4058 family protein [Planctomycetota bacterium]